MIKSRSAFNMPSSRPRRIWLNGVGAQNGIGKEEELRKSLPYCDMETGTKNRVVERDPIAGLGLLGKEYDPFLETRQSSTPRTTRVSGRNPLEPEPHSADTDTLRPRGRPGKVSIHQAQRDPISGRGEFGREWDPVHKYAGRPRPYHQRAADDPRYYKFSERPSVAKTEQKYIIGYYAKRGGRCNPLTGEDAKTFDINQELRRTPRKGTKKSNPVTGENCESYTVSDKLNEKHVKTGAKKTARGGNPVTGENCKSFDFNIESKSAGSSPRKAAAGGNPVTGENCTVYAYSSEFKPKPSKPNGEAKNPLTGANCPSFTVSSEERPKTAPSALQATTRASSNPVTGVGCRHYVLCSGEKKMPSSPPTPREPISNPLTGSNVRCFDINQEMRVNRRANDGAKPAENGHQTNGLACDLGAVSARSNPITGM